MPCSKRFALFALLNLVGCSHAKMAMIDTCSPLITELGPGSFSIVCPDRTYLGKDVTGFMCYRPEDIEPLLEKCTK